MARKSTINRKQTFHLSASGAKKVLLAGDFTDWLGHAIAMQRGIDGNWSATVSLPPGNHSYLYVVDGEWRDDPDCVLRVPNPFGGFNMVRQVI